MAVLIQPQLPTSITVTLKPTQSPASATVFPSVFTIGVNVARPNIMTAFGPISAPDIDGRYQPPLNVFISY